MAEVPPFVEDGLDNASCPSGCPATALALSKAGELGASASPDVTGYEFWPASPPSAVIAGDGVESGEPTIDDGSGSCSCSFAIDGLPSLLSPAKMGDVGTATLTDVSGCPIC